MRRTYRDEVSEESRKMIREYIKFDGRKPSEPGMCRSYEVPFMDGTDLKLGIRSGFYDATITKNIQGEKVPLFMTCGCRDKSELSNAMNLIKMIYESITGTKLAGFAPLLPFADVWAGFFLMTMLQDQQILIKNEKRKSRTLEKDIIRNCQKNWRNFMITCLIAVILLWQSQSVF